MMEAGINWVSAKWTAIYITGTRARVWRDSEASKAYPEKKKQKLGYIADSCGIMSGINCDSFETTLNLTLNLLEPSIVHKSHMKFDTSTNISYNR